MIRLNAPVNWSPFISDRVSYLRLGDIRLGYIENTKTEDHGFIARVYNDNDMPKYLGKYTTEDEAKLVAEKYFSIVREEQGPNCAVIGVGGLTPKEIEEFIERMRKTVNIWPKPGLVKQ
jgi:hypothetical protein